MEEKRRFPRQKVLKGARAVFNDGRSTISCIVRNVSEDGALLRFDSVIGLPDAFVLALADGTRRACAVQRRKGTEVGVKFLLAAAGSPSS